MFVSNNINDLLKVYKQQEIKNSRPAGKNGELAKTAKTDKVEISSQGQEILKVKKYLDQVPDIREDLVKELQEKIAKGTYDVSGRQIAEKMLGRSLVDEKI